MKKTGKKGFTLTELCVVLALIAIVSGMVVSFATMISARTKLSTARLNAMGDLELVESTVEGWMSRADQWDATCDLSFKENEKTLTGTLLNGEKITVKLDHVVGVKYKLLPNTDTGDYLCVCKVTLKLSSGETETRTICIDPHVGDIYGQVISSDEQEGEPDENA